MSRRLGSMTDAHEGTRVTDESSRTRQRGPPNYNRSAVQLLRPNPVGGSNYVRVRNHSRCFPIRTVRWRWRGGEMLGFYSVGTHCVN